MDDKFKKNDQTNIDSRTGSIKGSDVYNNYYFPKIKSKKEQPASSLIDSRTGSIKGSDVYNNYYFPKIEKSEGRHR